MSSIRRERKKRQAVLVQKEIECREFCVRERKGVKSDVFVEQKKAAKPHPKLLLWLAGADYGLGVGLLFSGRLVRFRQAKLSGFVPNSVIFLCMSGYGYGWIGGLRGRPKCVLSVTPSLVWSNCFYFGTGLHVPWTSLKARRLWGETGSESLSVRQSSKCCQKSQRVTGHWFLIYLKVGYLQTARKASKRRKEFAIRGARECL